MKAGRSDGCGRFEGRRHVACDALAGGEETWRRRVRRRGHYSRGKEHLIRLAVSRYRVQ